MNNKFLLLYFYLLVLLFVHWILHRYDYLEAFSKNEEEVNGFRQMSFHNRSHQENALSSAPLQIHHLSWGAVYGYSS